MNFRSAIFFSYFLFADQHRSLSSARLSLHFDQFY